jgi:hypothetical protein
MSGGSRQIGRIARLLGVDAGEVIGLQALPEPELRRLHDQISHSLFADGHARFARVAGLSKSLPGPVAGKLAERFLPAVLAARVAELLEPARARDLVNRVSVPYLGDISMVLDPVRSRPVVQAIPADRIGEVAREIFRQREYATMAEFAGTVALDALFAALGAATPRDLLVVVPMLEWNDNLDHVIRNLPAAQIEQIITELDATELAELALAIDPIRFGPIVHAVPTATGAAIAGVLFERREYAALARFFEVVPLEMVHAALGVASGRDVLEVAPLLPDGADLHLVIGGLPAERIDAILSAMVEHELWEHGELLVQKLTPEVREQLLSRAGDVSDAQLVALRRAAEQGRLGGVAAEMLTRA